MPKGLEGFPLPWPPPAGLPGRARAPPPSPPPGTTSPLTRLSPGGNSPAARWPPPQQHMRPGPAVPDVPTAWLQASTVGRDPYGQERDAVRPAMSTRAGPLAG